MATHHQTSPSGALHPHHGPPPTQLVQTNGHPPVPGPARPATTAEYLAQLNEQMWVQIGHLAEVVQNNAMAMEAYQRALNFNAWSVEALHAIASMLRAEDKYDQAVDYINRILKIQPANGESWSSLGHCYLMMDELQQAYSAYQSALYNLRDPKEPKLWYGIGILYDRYGSLDHAEEAFSQVMRMAPDFDKANEIYFRLGIIYKQQGKFRESLECFRYIASNPPHPLHQTDIWFQIGHVYEQQKDYESAKGAYRRVLERDPGHAKVLQQLGWLHHQQSTDYASQEQAIEYLEKSVNSDQTDAQSWYLLGRCYMSQHKFPKAYEAYQQAVYRDGRNPTFWCSIGVLYYQINQYRDALDAYSRAIRLNPNISEVWYDLGTLYESCNNQTSDALDAYQRAAELDPNNQHIKARLQLLRNGQATGIPTQSGAPPPQDVHPQAYQAALVTGPPQPQWGNQPASQNSHPQQPPPPPLQTSRDWNQPRLADIHTAPPPHQPPHTVMPFDPRDAARGGPLQSRGPSPRPDPFKHQESQRHTPMHKPLSPSPRARNAVPNLFSRPAQSMPPQGPPPIQSHQQQAPLNRITNPNFEGQTIPAPSPNVGPPIIHNPLPPYARTASAGPEVRPIMENRPPSPRSVFPHHNQPKPLFRPHHPDPGAPSGIASGAPAPASALAAAEAAARDRDDRPASVIPIKRHREWEDREDESIHKKNATEETRARLDDPYQGRRSPALPITPHEREKVGPSRMSAILSGPPSVPKSSPDGGRRAEEVRLANENYRPSEVAHHPAPLNTILQQERRNETLPSLSQVQVGTPMRVGTPGKREPTPMRNGPDEAQMQRQKEREEMDRRDRERELDRQERERRDRERREISMRIEEPAARKMDVDEDYDDDSGADDNRSKASNKGAIVAGAGSASGGLDSRNSPRRGRGSSVVSASGPSSQTNGMSNGGARPKIETA